MADLPLPLAAACLGAAMLAPLLPVRLPEAAAPLLVVIGLALAETALLVERRTNR